jgi:hypothetical protein
MNTQQLVSQLKEDFAPGYARTKLLAYIERAQNEMFNNDCAQMVFMNKSDPAFPIPILSTTATVLKYTPSASNLVDSNGSAISLTVGGYAVSIRRIIRVFIEDSANLTTYDKKFIGSDFVWAGVNENWSKRTSDSLYSEIPMQPFDKINSEDAHLVFVEDPGTHTDKYYLEAYYGPISLDSEDIPLSVDGDKWCEAFIKACRGYIEESRNGRSELLDGPANTGSFRYYWIPKFRNSMNAGIQRRSPYIFPTRECG